MTFGVRTQEERNTPVHATPPRAFATDEHTRLAVTVLGDLYRAVCGESPEAIRSYTDADAVLLLLRFDHAAVEDADALEAALMAVPDMVASAVAARTGGALFPGSLRISAERGVAVFAFRTDEEAGVVSADPGGLPPAWGGESLL